MAKTGVAGGGTDVSVRTVVLLCLAGAILFTLAFYKTVSNRETAFSDEPGATTFSTSALGHSALFELLRELKLPADQFRYSEGVRVPRYYGNLVVLAEPAANKPISPAIKGLNDAGAILIVLPKRIPAGRIRLDHWLSAVKTLPMAGIDAMLPGTLNATHVVRPDTPVIFSTNKIGITPVLKDPQLLSFGKLVPIVASELGILIGEQRRGDKKLWILSDPDLIANHGLATGDNALFTVRMMEALLPAGRRILFDETIHGFALPPSLWIAMFKPPWVAVTIAIGALCLTIGFVALNRFGRPVEAAQDLKAGKELLIGNTARVLVSGTKAAWLTREYGLTVMRDAAQRLRLHTADTEPDTLVGALSQAERGRNVSQPISAIWAEFDRPASPSARLNPALNIHKWREELLHDTR